jgi:hypothetical protein
MPDEAAAKKAIEFAQALAQFLFVPAGTGRQRAWRAACELFH